MANVVASVTHDCVISDGTNTYGLMLTEGSYRKGEATKFAPKTRQGNPAPGDFTMFSEWRQDTWHRGMTGDRAVYGGFATSSGVDTRIPYQAILGPATTLTLKTGSISLGSNAIRFLLFGGNWFCFAGNYCFKWNPGTNLWNQTRDFTLAVTDVAVFGGNIWAALGQSNPPQYSADGSAWTQETNLTGATYLASISQYLWAANPTSANPHYIYNATAPPGNVWSGPYSVGDSGSAITAITPYDYRPYVCKTGALFLAEQGGTIRGLWGFSGITSANNGKNAKRWLTSLYIPIVNGLYAFEPGYQQAVGPEQRQANTARTSRMAYVLPTGNFLSTATVPESGDSARVLQMDVNQNWHILVNSVNTSNNISALGWEDVTGATPRLWYSDGNDVYYMLMPLTGDNRYVDTAMTYAASGTLQPGIFDAGVGNTEKTFANLTVECKNISSTRTIVVGYRIDSTGSWTTLGTVDNTTVNTGGTFATFTFPTSSNGKRIELLFTLNRTTATDTPVLNAFTLRFLLVPALKRQFNMEAKIADQMVGLDGMPDGTKGQTVLDQLWTWRNSGTLLTFNDLYNNSYSVYLVQVDEAEAVQPAVGRNQESRASLILVEA